MEPRICDNCDATIGATDEKCPKCGVVLAELDADVAALENGLKILDKRKKRNEPPPPPPPPAPKGILGRLGRLVRKEGE